MGQQERPQEFCQTDLGTPILLRMGRVSSVAIATRYGLDGPGIESRWRVRFSAPVQTDPGGQSNLLYNGYRVFPGNKAAGAWC